MGRVRSPDAELFLPKQPHTNILQLLQIYFLSTLFSQYLPIPTVEDLELPFMEVPLTTAAFNHFTEWDVVLFLVFYEYFAEIYFF